MTVTNFEEKIQLYLESNPTLSNHQFGTLLVIDSLYNSVPEDINEFRQLYSHFDPGIIDKSSEGIIFLDIAGSNEPCSVIKHRLNNYINIKFNYLKNFLSYEENMKKFRKYSKVISDIMKIILETARFPKNVQEVLMERDCVKECYDFYDMLNIYKETKDKRIKYELLRKLGLIVLLTRIERTFIKEDINLALTEVEHVFRKGLGLSEMKDKKAYLWIDEKNKARYSSNKREAFSAYQAITKKRKELALPLFSMQIASYTPYKTQLNSIIEHIEFRNKFMYSGTLSSASFIEKIIRKNLQFANQIHDVIGIKLVVADKNEIPQLVRDLSKFLGGSSTRKNEKNTLDKFGKKKLSRYSSKDYFVWKAVYDISLPHPSIPHVNKVIELTKGNEEVQKELSKRLAYFVKRPLDYVVEVQIQDFNSYMLNIARGSTTDHSVFKMNQIRHNSFYKLFPKEIYEPELRCLRNQILRNQTSSSSSSSSSSPS